MLAWVASHCTSHLLNAVASVSQWIHVALPLLCCACRCSVAFLWFYAWSHLSFSFVAAVQGRKWNNQELAQNLQLTSPTFIPKLEI